MAQDFVPADDHDDIVYPGAIPFLLVHLACFGVIWTGFTTEAVILGVVLYLVRMFGVTAGFHRYFSHKTFRTSRVGQFALAWLGQSSGQMGAIWWAAKHRDHHKHSDTELDVHSPGQLGFFRAHIGWIFARRSRVADYSTVPDLTRYPELRWLDRHHKVPLITLGVICYLIAGWPGLVVGFFMSTVALYHGTFCINSLAHVMGRQRYVTGDDSRNNFLLALITLGEGWHNNHHHYPASTRQGFRWWEIDITYYILRVLAWTGLIWDLKSPPESVVRGDRRLPRPVVEKVARQLATSFSPEAIGTKMKGAWNDYAHLDELRGAVADARDNAESALAAWQERHADWWSVDHWPRFEAWVRRLEATREEATVRFEATRGQAAQRLEEAYGNAATRLVAVREQAAQRIAELSLPEIPTFEDIRHRALETYAATPSLEEIVARARHLIVEQVSHQLVGPVPALPNEA